MIQSFSATLKITTTQNSRLDPSFTPNIMHKHNHSTTKVSVLSDVDKGSFISISVAMRTHNFSILCCLNLFISNSVISEITGYKFMAKTAKTIYMSRYHVFFLVIWVTWPFILHHLYTVKLCLWLHVYEDHMNLCKPWKASCNIKTFRCLLPIQKDLDVNRFKYIFLPCVHVFWICLIPACSQKSH